MGFSSSSLLIALCSLFLLPLLCHTFKNSSRNEEHASIPPRGWNSYDSFCWTVSEEEFLQNSEVVAEKLHKYGYEYVVVDYLWYRKKVPGAYVDSYGYDVIDEWGRMIPDPVRWPSSRNGKGFAEVAKKVHDMGLKFGIHVMRGISTQAFQANTPILDVTKGSAYVESGRIWRAQDIGLKERACAWMTHGFMSVNTNTGAGKAFLKSLYHQYTEWGVDFVKHDCVFGDDLDINEITYVSEVLKELNRPILYSLSPGTSVTPEMAKEVSGLVNMYRITGDDWDTWGDVSAHFDVSRDFSTADMIGASGLLGKSWPDLDMLPLGKLTDPGSNEGPHRTCRLNLDEQRTQITLWAMAKSPFMFGGDVRSLDDSTFSIITNPIVLEINSFSSNNMEFPFILGGNIRTHRSMKSSLFSALYHGNLEEPKMDILGLASCKALVSSCWAVEEVGQELERVCWKQNTRSGYEEPFCLYKRSSLLASYITSLVILFACWFPFYITTHDVSLVIESRYFRDEERTQQEVQGKLHLSVSDSMDFCLGASPKRRLTSREFQRGSFYPCKWDANQMWELNHNGTLISSYSGLCAVVKSVTAKARNAGGVRSWIATGRKGEIYIAFFNLNEQKMVISAKVSDVVRALPRRKLHGACKYKEVWSGAESRTTAEVISVPVERHGCALFVLHCD